MGPRRSLRIGIAGSGLGGLAAACRLAQDGHQVQVFERSESLSIASGAIYVQSNAVRCIQRWGLNDAFQRVTTEIAKTQIRNGYTNQVLSKRQYSQFSQVPARGSDRQALQECFYDEARRHGASVVFNNPIVDINETSEKVTVTCKDGQTFDFDLCIAVDGISSRLRPAILSQQGAAKLTPIAAPSTHYPTEIPKDTLLANELTRPITSGEDAQDSLMFAGKGGYVVAKYNHSRQLLNIMWSIQHESGSEEDRNPRLFDEVGDPEIIRKFFSSFDPVVRALADMTTSCSRWRLARLEPFDTWSTPGHRAILLGDSAHAMLPNVAQGFSAIIEDIDCLSIMLNSEMPVQEAVQLWEKMRIPRVTRLQEISQYNYDCYNRGEAPGSALTEEQRNLPMGEGDPHAPFNSPPFMRWMYNYDTAQKVYLFHSVVHIVRIADLGIEGSRVSGRVQTKQKRQRMMGIIVSTSPELYVVHEAILLLPKALDPVDLIRQTTKVVTI